MKKRISLHMVASIVGPLCSPPDDEWEMMTKISPNDSRQLRELVRQQVVPHFSEFDEDSQQKMRNSLEYFLGHKGSGLERIFPAFHIPLEPPESARSFFAIVWDEIFGGPVPEAVDPTDFVTENSDAFANSLRKRGFPKTV